MQGEKVVHAKTGYMHCSSVENISHGCVCYDILCYTCTLRHPKVWHVFTTRMIAKMTQHFVVMSVVTLLRKPSTAAESTRLVNVAWISVYGLANR